MSDTSLTGKDGQFYAPDGRKFVYQNPMAVRHPKINDPKKTPSPVSLNTARAVAPVSFKPPKKGERSEFEIVTEQPYKQTKQTQEGMISNAIGKLNPVRMFSSMFSTNKKPEKTSKDKQISRSSSSKSSTTKIAVPKKEPSTVMAEPLDTSEEISVVEPAETQSMGDFESPRKKLRVANKYKENDNWKLVNARKPKPKPQPIRRPQSQSPIAMIRKEAGTSVEMIKQVENQQGMTFTMKEKSNTASFRIQSAEGIAKETKMLEKERKKNSRHSIASQRNKNPTNSYIPKDLEKPKNIWKRPKNVQMPPTLKMRTDDLRPDTREAAIMNTIDDSTLDKSNSNHCTIPLHGEVGKRDDVRYKPAQCKLSGPETPDFQMLIANVASGDKPTTGLPKKQPSSKRGFEDNTNTMNEPRFERRPRTPEKSHHRSSGDKPTAGLPKKQLSDKRGFEESPLSSQKPVTTPVANTEYGVKRGFEDNTNTLNEPSFERPRTPEKSRRRSNITKVPVTYEEPLSHEKGANSDGKYKQPSDKKNNEYNNDFGESESYLVFNYNTEEDDINEQASESCGFIDNIFKLFSPNVSKSQIDNREDKDLPYQKKKKNTAKQTEERFGKGRSGSVEALDRSRNERLSEGAKAATYIRSPKKKDAVPITEQQHMSSANEEKARRLIETKCTTEDQNRDYNAMIQSSKNDGEDSLYLKDLKMKTPYTKHVGDMNSDKKEQATPSKLKSERETRKQSAKTRNEQSKTPNRSKHQSGTKSPAREEDSNPTKTPYRTNKENTKTPTKSATQVKIEPVDEEVNLKPGSGIRTKSPNRDGVKNKTPTLEKIWTPSNTTDNKETNQPNKDGVKNKTPTFEKILTPSNTTDNKETNQPKENIKASPKRKFDNESKTPSKKQSKSPVDNQGKSKEEIKLTGESKKDEKVDSIKSPSAGKANVKEIKVCKDESKSNKDFIMSDTKKLNDNVNKKSPKKVSPIAKVEALGKSSTEENNTTSLKDEKSNSLDDKSNTITEKENTIEEFIEFLPMTPFKENEEIVQQEKSLNMDIYKDISPCIETITENIDNLMETNKQLMATVGEENEEHSKISQCHFKSPAVAYEEDHLIRIPLYGKQQNNKSTKRDTKAKANMLAPRTAEHRLGNKWAASHNKLSMRDYCPPPPAMTKQQILAFGGSVALPRGMSPQVSGPISNRVIPSIIAAKEQRFHFSKCSGNSDNSVIVQPDVNCKDQESNPLQVFPLDNDYEVNRPPSVYNLNKSPVLNAFPVCTSLSAEHLDQKPVISDKLISTVTNNTKKRKTKPKTKHSNIKSNKSKKQTVKVIKVCKDEIINSQSNIDFKMSDPKKINAPSSINCKSDKDLIMSDPKKLNAPSSVNCKSDKDCMSDPKKLNAPSSVNCKSNKDLIMNDPKKLNAPSSVPPVAPINIATAPPTMKSPKIHAKTDNSSADSPMANVTSAAPDMKSPTANGKGYAANSSLYEMFRKYIYSENSADNRSLDASERGEVP